MVEGQTTYTLVNPSLEKFYNKSEMNVYSLTTDTTILNNKKYYIIIKNDVRYGETGHPFYRKWKINIPKGQKAIGRYRKVSK